MLLAKLHLHRMSPAQSALRSARVLGAQLVNLLRAAYCCWCCGQRSLLFSVQLVTFGLSDLALHVQCLLLLTSAT
jgi:hypothetical protein